MTWFFIPLIRAGALVLAAVLFVLLSAACEAGFRVGRWRGSKVTLTKEEMDTTNTLTAGMLALLAFILGFTIDFAQHRFDARRDLVVEEANAISTAWRRGEMTAGPDGAALVTDLGAYARTQLDFIRAELNGPLPRLVETTHALESDIWAHATTVARGAPTPITANLIAALNAMFDAAQSTRYAFDAQVPTDMLAMLLWGSLLSIGAMGYQMGVAGARQPILSSLLLLMWTGGMVMTVDLNRPRLGNIRVDSTPLEWVVHDIDAGRLAAARAAPAAQ